MYKRQVSNHPYGPFEDLSVEEPFLSIEKLEKGIVIDQVIAVSYTHLDVYKRQR